MIQTHWPSFRSVLLLVFGLVPHLDLLVANELSPAALVVARDGATLFIGSATANAVLCFDVATRRITRQIEMPAPVLGLALTREGQRLYAACAAPESRICEIDVGSGTITRSLPAGHTAMAPVLSLDEQRLFVCNRFNNDLSVIDLETGLTLQRIPVQREPVAAAITPDGRHLLVANHVQAGTADHWHAATMVSVVDTEQQRVIREIDLGLGSGLLRGIAISPDGRFAAVTHIRARHWLPTKAVEFGQVNCNAVTFLNLQRFRVLAVLLLDQDTRGAAGPWGVTWTPDGRHVLVTHAGTHELSMINAPVDADPENFLSMTLGRYMNPGAVTLTAPPKNPVRVRQRIPLPGKGPRALAVSGEQVYVANYFSDNLARIELGSGDLEAEPLPLTSPGSPSLARLGELYFNDATLCFQGWQSCASCHDVDARMDAFDWDMLNDGEGNPKNTKSLLWAHRTPPSMALGVRANASVAVRAGMHHILFNREAGDVPAAIDAFLSSLEPVLSPHLIGKQLSPAAERGRRIFHSAESGCATCHPPPLFTDLKAYDVGTAGEKDKTSDRFDTPTLVEVWRTAPYFHDGSVVRLQEVFTKRNPGDRHGKTSHLSAAEIEDLVAYVGSL